MEFDWGFPVAIVIFLFSLFFLGFFTHDIISYPQEKFNKEVMSKVEECQETLPRNVRCVIVAVPETEIEGEGV